MTSARPVVAIWKSTWLPSSQTFVQNQVGALRRWRPVLIGVRPVSDGLPVIPDLAPFGSGLPARALHRVRRATGYRGVYDTFLRTQDTRLVHAHFGTSAIPILPVTRRLGLPLVVTFHGYDVTREAQRSGHLGEHYRRRLGEVIREADTLIAVSEFIAERLLALGAPPSSIRVHHIGIPVDQAPWPGPRERAGIAFVGRLVEKKGVADLLAAVEELDRRGVRRPVRIIGDGPLRGELERRSAAAGLDVSFLGFRRPDEVAALLRESSVFCAPSRTAADGDAEAFGMVFLEAALQGLPVVSYRHGGVPEAVQDGVTGLLADEGDVPALARNLELLLADPARARTMGQAGSARVRRDFDVMRQSALLEDIYAAAAARGGRPVA